MKYLAAIVLGGALLVSCERYTEPEITDVVEPVFFIETTINGTSHRLDADDGYVASSSYEMDSLGVISYLGSISECETCEPVWQLKWRSNHLEEPSLTQTVEGLHPLLRQREDQDPKETYHIVLDADPSELGGQFSWLIDGEAYNSETVNLDIERDDDKTYLTVELTASYAGGCTAMISDTVFLPNHGCNCRISSKKNSENEFTYRATKTAVSGVSFDWAFSGGANASSRELIYAYSDLPANGVEEIRLSTAVNGCNATAHYQEHFSQVPNSCAINFKVEVNTSTEPSPPTDAIDLNHIELLYSEAGRTYSSYLVKQPEASFVQIDDVEVYTDLLDETEKPGRKVSGTFRCLMVHGIDTIQVNQARFVLPIGRGADQ